MAKRRKTRTHNKNPPTAGAGGPTDPNSPKSFIIKHGQVGSAVSALVRDMRKVMEPNTATRLRERTRNKLRDYLSLAPALSVTHILLFTLTPLSPYLRIIRTPSGPSATFRLLRYSTSADLRSSKRNPKGEGWEYKTAPLMVMSQFPADGPLGLAGKLWQSVFPPLSPHTLKPSSARRVVLLSHDKETNTIHLRHYLITIRSFGVSRRVRKVLKPGLDLGKVKDVADWLLGEEGYESASSAGSEGEEVDLPLTVEGGKRGMYASRRAEREGSVLGGGSVQGEGRKRAVKLEEVGPRLELRLVKITEGVPGKEGGVIFHEFVQKTEAEVKAQEKEIKEREKVRKQRREEQERNVARKKAEQGGAGGSGSEDEGQDGADDNEEEEEEEEEDGAEEEDGERLAEEEEDWEDELEEAEESDVAESSDEDEEDAEPAPPPKRAKARG